MKFAFGARFIRFWCGPSCEGFRPSCMVFPTNSFFKALCVFDADHSNNSANDCTTIHFR